MNGSWPDESTPPLVMGILNVTSDSFSDGGRFLARDAALRQAERMLAEGAAIIDVGGESTRPGAKPVSVQEELDRVIPLVESITRDLGAAVSVDSSKPQVMTAAAAAGATLINDVRALRAPGALEAAAASGAQVCLMHMQGEPGTMQQDPRYADVVDEVREFLAQRVAVCEAAGIPRGRLLIDPGFGFGKRLDHNLALLRHLDAFHALGLPILVGLSRKSMIGQVLDRPVDQRLYGSLALAVLAVWQGAAVVRVHDVGPTVDALRMAAAVRDVTVQAPWAD
jgi:dihydropteroate synthase